VKEKKTKYRNFLEKDYPPPPPEKALFHIISAPYEDNISYGRGTSKAPKAIIEASQYLEIYGEENEPAKLGIYTKESLKCKGKPAEVLDNIANHISETIFMNAIPVLLGGEHTVSYAMVKALYSKYKKNFFVIHFDSHADLRDEYYGNKYSHACVMRRIHEDFGINILQIGTRAYCKEEDKYRKENGIKFIDSSEIHDSGIPEKIIPDNFPLKAYISFDVDGLDPSVIPATGTPEPGGLLWNETIKIIEKISASCEIIAFDLVELAPIPKLHYPDYSAAKLTYKLMQATIKSKKQGLLK